MNEGLGCVYRTILRRRLPSDAKDTQKSSGRLQTSGRADGKSPAGTEHGWLNPMCGVARRKKRKEVAVAHVQKYCVGTVSFTCQLG